jgi:CDP-glycerol glycerophosphotransferase (TagB/SpsB family)
MSMRLGEAPGGGNRWLAPLKWGIANTFGRIRFLSEPLIYILYEFLFPRPFSELFKKYKPDLVFIPNVFDRFDQELSREARLLKIEHIGMVLNWDHYDKYYIPFVPDVLLMQSGQMEDFAIRYQNKSKKNISLVGYPFLDHLNDPLYIESKQKVLQELNFPDDAQYILYVAGSMYSPDEPDIIEEMIAWADAKEIGKNVHFVIRPYPGGRGKDEAFDEKKFQGFSAHPRVSFQMQKFWAGFETNAAFMNIVRHADVVLAVYSTAVLPAVAMDRPTLTFMFDGYKDRPYHRSIKRFAIREHYKDVLESGGQAMAMDFADLKNKLKQYLEHPKTDGDKRALMRPQVIGPLDGKASERIYQALTHRIYR